MRHDLWTLRFAFIALLLASINPNTNASAAPTSKPKTPLFHESRRVTPTHKGLQHISQQLNLSPVVRAAFQQHKTLKSLRFPLRSHGTFLLARDKGVSWQMLAPFPTRIVITSQGLTQTTGKQTTRITRKNKPALFGMTSMFLAMFSGNPATLHKHFHIYLQQQHKTWTIGLRPKHPLLKKIFSSMILQGTKTITNVQMNERSGDTTRITFTKIRTTPTALTTTERALFLSK
jgi:outer membrane lipoprotein-sorting protein